MSCGGEKVFEFGERRRVTLRVWLNDHAEFTPQDCSYQLLLGTKAEAEGACDARQDGDAWELTCEIQPKTRYTYRLQYTFTLGTELVKRSVGIKVI